MKNFVEFKGDIALVHIESKGKTEIAIFDREVHYLINLMFPNKLNIDSGGHVQHREQTYGKYDVDQIHRVITNAYNGEKVIFKNGNKLDLRRSNLQKI